MLTELKRPATLSSEKSKVFWGEIAPPDHLLQIYENDAEFLAALGKFVADGFRKNESVIVIGTAWHLNALEKQLSAFDTDVLRARNQYIPLDAEETLSKFMVEGWPNQQLFERCVTDVLRRASQNGRGVRAFGEMVALLWAQENHAATIQLEILWHQFQKKNAFSLFCAYPKNGFRENSLAGVQKICDAHSKMVPGSFAI